MTIAQFDPVPANNATAITGVTLSEGQTPGSLNDAIRQIVADIAVWYAAVDPAGRIAQYGGSSAPTGWLECDGSAVDRTTYARLFTAISTTWGIGNGTTTFNVPDLRGRVLVGKGTGSGLTARTLAATGGEETHTLTASETPVLTAADHVHQEQAAGAIDSVFPLYRFNGGGTDKTIQTTTGLLTSPLNTLGASSTTVNAGGGSAHQNMQPFTVTMFIIRI